MVTIDDRYLLGPAVILDEEKKYKNKFENVNSDISDFDFCFS